MIPFRRPPPLSAWTLVGVMIANPQPFPSACSCQPGAPPPGGAAPFFPKPPGPPNPPKLKPNSIITGTGPAAPVGVVRVSWMSTVIDGQDELSAWPTSVF